MVGGSDGNAGLIGKAEGSLAYDFGSQATSSAQGGRIGSSFVSNSAGGGIGIVKMLAMAGVAVILLKLLKK